MAHVILIYSYSRQKMSLLYQCVAYLFPGMLALPASEVWSFYWDAGSLQKATVIPVSWRGTYLPLSFLLSDSSCHICFGRKIPGLVPRKGQASSRCAFSLQLSSLASAVRAVMKEKWDVLVKWCSGPSISKIGTSPSTLARSQALSCHWAFVVPWKTCFDLCNQV